MSTWHYQLIKHIYPKGDVHYAVHEYYPATEEVGEAWTLSPVALWGESLKEIEDLFNDVLKDIGRHGIIEVEHDDYGLVHADNAGLKLFETCGRDRNED